MGLTARTPSGAFTQVRASEDGKLLVESSAASAPGTGATAQQVQGAVATGQTASTTNPIRAAGIASTLVSALGSGAVGDFLMTLHRALIVRPWAIPEKEWAATNGVAGTTATAPQAMKAAVAGEKNYVTSAQISNMGLATTVSILRGTTVLWAMSLATGQSVQATFADPLASAVNEAINYQQTAASTLNINMQGYTAP